MKSENITAILYILIIGGPIAAVFYGGYYLFIYIQEQFFIGNDGYIIIPNTYLHWVFILFGVLLFFLICSRFEGNEYILCIFKIYDRVNVNLAYIIYIILFCSALLLTFYSYTKVSDEGITYRANILASTNKSEWKKVEKVQVYYSSEHTKVKGTYLKFHYSIVLENGKSIDLREGTGFWGKIVMIDSLLVNKRINIERSYISRFMCIELMIDDYSGNDDGMNVLSKLVNVGA